MVAGVGLAVFPLNGLDGEELVLAPCGLSALACAGVLSLLVPWLLTPYRQWDRTLRALSVMMIVAAVVRTGQNGCGGRTATAVARRI
ncbi:hypothetical protein [Glycomyces rhizosphaerae]|uniref:Uncharacterized protein n=1 Tax=Glycomyces rhizosphaerae TaxID=2054422 RepID=A0ABV7PVS3_9ACTN